MNEETVTDLTSPPDSISWHSLPLEEAAGRLNTEPDQGLSPGEAQRRLREHGPNQLERRGGPNPWLMFGRQFTEPLVLLLVAAAVVSAFTGELTDTVVIAVIVVLNAILGFSQEYRAQRALEALRSLAEPTARVIREGHLQEIPAVEVVPGDLIILEAGMRVVADARLVEVANLQTDEAPLTGEAYPVDKQVEAVADQQVPLGDRRCLVYSSTTVTRGRGRALVFATGMATELGKIAALLQETGQATTPLQKRLSQVGTVLAGIAVAVCGLVLVAGLLRQHSLQEMFLTAIALAVAAVPEGLPAVITIALALGAQRMVRRHALIRRLPAVETLGSVTVICTDKTGTLTEGAMRPALLYTLDGTQRLVEGTWQPGEARGDAAQHLLRAMALCNDAYLPRQDQGEPDYAEALGDPTEVALLAAALAAGTSREDLIDLYPRLAEIPFDAERKRMTTLHPKMEGLTGQYLSMVKGAPDQVLSLSNRVYRGGEAIALDDQLRREIAEQNAGWAASGLRVLAAAYRPLAQLPLSPSPEQVETDLVFLGLVALQDPPRPEVAEAIEHARQAGIRTVMITGDYAATGASIAQQVGLSEEGHRVVEGRALQDLSVEELTEQVEEIDVYARVSPADKVKVVEAWQHRGQIVAVTGDGVNDAAALQRAEIGIAMGQVGTEVAKDASDMVLLDDNYATIVAAIEQGRVIYDNIRKFIRYLLATNTGEIWTIFFGILFGWPLALLPVQILWINLVTDGLPALALGFEPAEGDVMRRPPRSPKESLFSRGMGYNIIWTGLLMAVLTLGLFYWHGFVGDQALARARTLAFFTLAGLQMANVLSVRMERQLVFGKAFFGNPRLLAAVALTLAGQLAVTYVPFLQRVFKTAALSSLELGLALSACVFFFLFSEFINWLEIHRARNREAAA